MGYMKIIIGNYYFIDDILFGIIRVKITGSSGNYINCKYSNFAWSTSKAEIICEANSKILDILYMVD